MGALPGHADGWLKLSDLEFSIVIPTYCRPPSLQSCLEAIGRQEMAPPFEVIVVNDGGPDLTSVLADFQTRMSLRLIQQENRGPATARNRGVDLAVGDRVVFLDDDCRPEPCWLALTKQAADIRPEALIGGRTVNLLEDNPFAATSQLLIDFLYEAYASSGKQERFFATNNLSLPRNRFLELGGFNEEFRHAAGEDREFCLRWQQAELPMHYDPSIIIGHLHHMGPWGFLRQHFRYGQAAHRYWATWSSHYGPRSSVRILAFQKDLLRYTLKRHGLNSRGLLITLLMVLAQVATAAGYLKTE
jgi:glycosyltransferase involved in cell wall biosynthesis